MKRIYSILILLIVFSACNKELKIDQPSFNVSASAVKVKVGDSVLFNIEGNPDIISFYSGEIGNSYVYADKDRILPTDAVSLLFQSQVRSQSGTSATYCQDKQFHVMVSSDLKFTGNTMADSALNVKNATWQEITSRFIICPLECSSTTPYYSSGTKDITDLFESGKPLYFGFRYINKPNTTNGRANIWRFASLEMTASTAIGTATLTNQANAGWKPVYIGEGWDATRFINANSIITMRGYTTNEKDQELWCISNPVEIVDANLGREFAKGIKSYSDPQLKVYGHRFTKAGTYTVTFVATNSNVYDRKEIVRQIELTIEP